MSLINELEIKDETVLQVAKLMAVAARTAPKARGIDNLEIVIISGDTIVVLANKMKELAEEKQMQFFNRDAANILLSPVVLLIGVKIKSTGLPYCGYCGMNNCESKNLHADLPCAFNLVDLGIAIGSAVSVASSHHIDNRVMFSIGKAAIELKLLSDDVRDILAIPLSAVSKSPFFDRG